MRNFVEVLKAAISFVLLFGSAAAQTHTLTLDHVDAAEKHHPSRQTTWDVKYKAGSLQLRKERWLKAAFVSDPTADKPGNPIVVISTGQVRSVVFNPKAQRDSDLSQHMARSGCAYANSLMPRNNSAPSPALFLAWIESPGPMSRIAEHLNARYPLKFIWNDGAFEREIVLSVDRCEYASFLANVRWFMGARWPSVGRAFPR